VLATDARREIVAWWERRRFLFNAVNLLVGMCSLALVYGFGGAAVEPGEDFVEPMTIIFGVPLYVLVLNAVYPIGWETEVLTGQIRTPGERLRAFRLGLLLSSAITALPGLWACVYWLVQKL
jgi:hypothetical protein